MIPQLPTMLHILAIGLAALIEIAVIVRVMLRPHRDPAARIAWVAVVISFPLVGALAYLLVGEVRVSRQRKAEHKEAAAEAPLNPQPDAGQGADPTGAIPLQYRQLFRLGESISGFLPVEGNHGRLLADSNATIDAMVADIDAAKETVHVVFYIWLADNNGLKIVEALKRAAGRGVQCRALADDLGSRALIHSPHWGAMRQAGVRVAAGLPIGNPFLRPFLAPFLGRVDVRNHRKIVVIDGRITYCGSQNCADPEFRVKARFAPWVDAVMRFEGPVAHQNQLLFTTDWLTNVDEPPEQLSSLPPARQDGGVTAQVIGTGPTIRYSAMPEMFEAMFFAAQREIVISTPYYVPDGSLHGALCTAGYRGIDTSVVFPARNDSWVVAAASRSYYADLIEAGVKIYEYTGGLLHAKTLTIDGDLTLIGSANMDRRSFDLNYENNILLFDHALTADMRARQQDYIDKSVRVTRETVEGWSIPRRLWNNFIAVLGPVL